MPKLTNKLNLPQALVDAVANDDYTKGNADLSVTQLLKPMRAVVLEKLHGDEVVEDVADRLWSFYGKIAHKILEGKNQDKNIIVERRLYMDVHGVRISGAMDSYEVADGRLIDWKFVTAYKFKGTEIPEEWEQQQNLYAALLRANGQKITSLEIVGLLRDHSKMEARRDEFYPQLPVARMPIPLWPEAKVAAFLVGKINEYKKALEQLPHCSDKERWARPTKWAVKKPGAQRALKLHDDLESARNHADALKLEVEHRPGENIRCENYCSVSKFCAFYQELKKKEIA